MTIAPSDLKFYQSERMTDENDGGGRMSGNEILSHHENQIFDDITDVARAAGAVSIRKGYAAVTSANTDKYLDAGVIVFRPPDDPAVSVLLMTTGDFYDERSAIQARLEQTISRGVRYNGWLYGPHYSGMRAILIWQRPETDLLAVGSRLEIVSKIGSSATENYSEFVWVTRVVAELRTMYENSGTAVVAYQVRVLTCEIAEPLNQNYNGLEPSRADPAALTATALVYATRYNAEAIPLHSVQPLSEPAAMGDFSVKVAALYTPLVPTGFAETALPDVTPGGDTASLVASNTDTIHFTTSLNCITPDTRLFFGGGIMPGTLSIAVSGSTLTDSLGDILLAGLPVGALDYSNGVATWNSACPAYGTAIKTCTFQPVAKPLRVADTAALAVTAENRGYSWVLTLTPIPAPRTLRVAYRVNGVWYVLYDLGGGLKGVDTAYGTGLINYTTGTVTVMTGALPDVGSDILFTWATPVNYTSRGGASVAPPKVTGQTVHFPVAPTTFAVAWTDPNNVTRTLTDDGAGALSGTGGTGTLRYATGEWSITPTLLPAPGTDFIAAYTYGAPLSERIPGVLSGGMVTLSLAHTNLLAGSVDIEFAYAYGTAILKDDGVGNLLGNQDIAATVDYVTGTISMEVTQTTTVYINTPIYEWVRTGTEVKDNGHGGVETFPIFSQVQTGTASTTLTDSVALVNAGTQYTIHYRTTDTPQTASDEATPLALLTLDLTKGYQELIVAGSVRFRLGGALYVDTAGQLYKDPSVLTGAGSLAGTLDPSTGTVRLSVWSGGGTNAVTLESLVTALQQQVVDKVIFRTPVSPLKPGTLQVRYTELTGAVRSKSVDSTGILTDSDAAITVDFNQGVVKARFGVWKVDAELTPSEKLEAWYNPDHRVDFAGTLKIWKSTLVLADSILYNAVAQTFLPPDSHLLGLNSARLPPNGKALVFNVGRLALVHHTDSIAASSLSPTQVIDCGRVRLYRVVIEDSAGTRLGADQYTVNLAAGTVTMSPTLDLTGFTAPYAIRHTVADLGRITETDINGTLTFNKPVSHDYPADAALVSSMLYIGTLQARVANLFAQSTWTSVWSDTLIGSEPLAQYNDAQWPIIVANRGAYPDRFLVKFTSSTVFQVIGENLGVIGIGDTSTDCAPVNSLSGQPYFTIPHQGWGSGWATGNCLRFNLIGACYPVDLIRAIQPSTPSGSDPDAVELLLIGNVDA